MITSVKRYIVLSLSVLSFYICVFSQNKNIGGQTILMAQQEEDSIPLVPVLTIEHSSSADLIRLQKLNDLYRKKEKEEITKEKSSSVSLLKKIDPQEPIIDPDWPDPIIPHEPEDPIIPPISTDIFPTVSKDSLLQKLNPVGEIPMNTNVSPSGALAITVPIDCYAGIGDAQPHISLVYNSQLGNGIMGMGWNLGGISKINAVKKNLYYDGNAAMLSTGLMGSISDVYVLDGNRLIKSGNNYITANGNIKVTNIIAPNASTINSGFQCYLPDGSQCTYTQTGIKEYSISSFKDKNGNEVIYNYTTDSPIKLLSQITYLDGKASIEFIYSTSRPDPVIRYINGYKDNGIKRLESIKCKLNGITLRVYTFNYSTAQTASVLYALGCKSGDRMAKPLYFNYGTENYNSGFTTTAAQGLSWYNFEDPATIAVQRGKIGWGYGTEDDGLVHYPAKSPFVGGRSQHGLGHSKYYYYNQYEGDESIFIYSGLNAKSETSTIPNFTDPMPTIKTEAGFVSVIFADVDRLPGEELIKINSTIENDREVLFFSVYASSGTTGLVLLYKRRFDMGIADIYHRSYRRSVWPREFYPVDINGDGRWEILAVSLHQPLGYDEKKSRCWVFDLELNSIKLNQQVFTYEMATIGHKSSSNPDRLEVLDLNKDGKSDILLINDSGLHVYEFTGNYLINTKNMNLFTKSDMERGDVYESLVWGDFNSDGIPDFIKSLKNYQGLYFGKGEGTFEKSSISIPYIGNTERKMVAQDLDGDGYTDLLQHQYNSNTKKTTVTVYLWNLYGNFSYYGSFTMDSHGIVIPTNINSNDYYSRISYLKNGVVTIQSLRRNNGRERLLSKMTNSMGIVQNTKYGQLMESSGIYTSSYISKDKYPYATFQGNAYAISRLDTKIGNKVEKSNRYHYTNAVIHKHGLGFCGFTEIYVSDTISNHWTKNTFNPLNYGVPISEETQSSRYDMEYTSTIDYNKKLHILLKKRIDKNKLTGVTTVTNLTYDTKDFPLTEITDYGEGISRTITTIYQHTDTLNRYALGLPLSIRVSTVRERNKWIQESSMTYDKNFNTAEKKVNIGDLLRSKEHYTYDRQGNVLSKLVQAYSSDNQLTESYVYDDYGRRTKETDAAGITTSYTYDNETGLLKSISDYKGRITTFMRDAWGRNVKITLPDGSQKISKYEWASSTAFPSLVCKLTETSNNNALTTTFYDSMGRDIHSNMLRFNGKLLNVNKEYNDQGLLYRISLPYVMNPTQWTVYTYDRYNRPSTITAPGGKIMTYNYKNNTVTETKDGITCTKVFDSTGSLISVSDVAGTITYQLRPDGQPSAIISPGNAITSFVYDEYGRRTEIHDPSAGIRTTVYDIEGNVSKETDANGKTVTSIYDKLHRLTSHINAENIKTIYTYNARGNLLTEISNNGISKIMEYDNLDRLSALQETIVDGQWLKREYTYAPTGCLQSVSYSTSSGNIGRQSYIYNNGYHTQTKWSDGQTIYELQEETEQGEISKILTAGVTRLYEYNAYGMPNARLASSTKGNLMHLVYNFDANTGNLLSREDYIRNQKEYFTYDNLNRLTTYGGQTVDYDIKGNIIKKSDAGTFLYEQASKPYAITALAPVSNSIQVRDQILTYTSYMRPSTIVENGYTCAFTYNASNDRVKTYITHNGTLQQIRYYIGNIYEKETSGSSVKERLYLEGDYYSAPMVAIKEDTGSWKLYNILRDYQGSIIKITDASGSTTIAEYSYDAWGRMREPATKRVYDLASEPTLFLGRGYTGHEHLAMFGLINMNARLYDPVIGRFLSPDPYVQMIDFSQNFNRYGYCLNNPMKYVDKNGEFIHIIIGAAIGGIINFTVKAVQGKIHNFGDGFAAFGIGAAAGAFGAFTGGLAFVAAGGSLSVAGAGGFIAGAAGGLAGSVTAAPIQSAGNSLYFGDPFLKPKDLLYSAALGALTGGAINGTIAAFNGCNFWNGDMIASGRGTFSFNNTSITEKTTAVSPNGKSEITPDPLPAPASADQSTTNSTMSNSPSSAPLDKVREMAEKLQPGLNDNLKKGQEFMSILQEDQYTLNVRVETHGTKFGVPEFELLKVPIGTPIRHMNVQLFETIGGKTKLIFNRHIILDVK